MDGCDDNSWAMDVCLQVRAGGLSNADMLSLLVALPGGIALTALIGWLRRRTIAALLTYTGWVFEQSSLTTKVSQSNFLTWHKQPSAATRTTIRG